MAINPTVPRFNCSLMEGCIIVSMNADMADSLLSLLQEFGNSELRPFEFALMKQLERLVERSKGQSVGR